MLAVVMGSSRLHNLLTQVKKKDSLYKHVRCKKCRHLDVHTI
jgi:hypothetical protein